MQDMTPPQERSIRNIPITPNHRSAPREEQPPQRRAPSRKTPFFRKFFVIIGILLLCGLAGIAFSTFFEGTTVTITPHSQSVTPSDPVTAAADASSGMLAYQTLSVTRSATTTAPASGTQHVSKPATGLITIYNAYSTKSQTLITNTRFATPSGSIYRIHAAVVVPGETKTSAGVVQPGSVTVSVYADQPGDTYNLASTTTFTIPGFQNTPEYTGFSAQSQGPIQGGFIGDQATVAPADLTNAQNTLKQSLDTTLTSAVTSTIPSGFSVIPGTLQTSYADIAQSQNPDSSITFSQSATGVIAIVRDSDLASAIAKQTIPTYNNEPVTFAHPDALALSLAGGTSGAALGPLSITVGGPVVIVWQIDQDAIAQALVGKAKASFETIIQSFAPGVEQAKAQVRPFWETHFPTNPKKITVTIVAPQ